MSTVGYRYTVRYRRTVTVPESVAMSTQVIIQSITNQFILLPVISIGYH